jgi:hypothetical protein
MPALKASIGGLGAGGAMPGAAAVGAFQLLG